MTELPRYIGRHASPGAAAPPSDETTPEEIPSTPRLDFDPGHSDEVTTVLDDADAPDRTPPGPEPPVRELGPSGTGRLPGSPGRPIRPDSWTMRPGRSSTPLADSVANTPPTPPFSPAPASPPVGPFAQAPSEGGGPSPPDAEPWTSQAPDIPAGPLPVPEPIIEAVRAPRPASELPDHSEPESEAIEASEADLVGAEPDDAEPGPESDVARTPEPESESDAESETNAEPEAETDSDPHPESDAELDLAPDPEPEPTAPEPEPSSSSAPSNSWRDEPMLTPAPGPIRRSPVRREIDSHGLARLALLDAVDETWPGGTPDLSAWLAGNLELLEDPLGFSLETRHPVPMSPERQATGGYDAEGSPLDLPGNIVTVDVSGATVMVRAQVGEADPEGLGALLTAAGASEAQTAVWVCPRIDEGYRQALRWVGGDPSANVRLYGLEMYLVRINDSSTAPLFDAVVAPGAP